ncbi:hypothetical protein Clacol_008079 [Clathrus columnatus]|uniref:AMP-dependent synthetase/ligase domain-containing protein n=1 Tax=Clathrus columnatus TaxID=1419009 RepID=A0AAV5AJ86_9AGAM|nr:hypothetical protein Clacol_008079 [Clathrus columnatus]
MVVLRVAGMSYTDAVHLFSLIRAGLVPHNLHLDFQVVDTVIDLFTETRVSAIICAPSAPMTASLQDHFKIHTIMELDKLPDIFLDDVQLPPIQNQGSGDDIVMIFNTTGSTSGRPKVVKSTRQWLDTNARKELYSVQDGKQVALRVGSFSHMGQFIISLVQIKNAACIVLTPWINFTPDELVYMIKECKINVIHQFAAILTRLLKAATTNPELTSALQSLKFIVHGGSSIGEEESNWAMEHEIPLKNAFGLTETGMVMTSTMENNEVFYPLQLPGLKYEFWPVDETQDDLPRARILELVILKESLDCPYPSSCDPVGGYYRSKDLFEEVHPGAYKYRGRLDDMIKMENARLCDTKYIEDQVSNSCKNLISWCVVVGSGKPSPVLLVEPFSDSMDVDLLKEEIGKKVKLINEDSYFHERIEPSHILVVPRGQLPRTTCINLVTLPLHIIDDYIVTPFIPNGVGRVDTDKFDRARVRILQERTVIEPLHRAFLRRLHEYHQ